MNTGNEHDVPSDPVGSLTTTTKNEKDPTATSIIICSNCNTPETEQHKLTSCPCHSVRYCNKTCQKAHRKQHKKECRRLMTEKKLNKTSEGERKEDETTTPKIKKEQEKGDDVLDDVMQQAIATGVNEADDVTLMRIQSPLFQQGLDMLADPELLQQALQNNPKLQRIASHPQLQQILSSPAMLQQSLQMMQQMSNNNLEKHPGSGVSSSGVSSINNLNAVYDALQRSTFESDLEYAVNGFYGVDNEFEGELLMDAVFGDPKDKRMQRTANGLKVYVCANCNESFAKSDNTRNLCSGCKLVRYCSRDCQRSHWSVGADGEKGHKRYCQLMKDAAAAVE